MRRAGRPGPRPQEGAWKATTGGAIPLGVPVAPVFSSIEEYLGRNTPSYYEVLVEVGQGAWNPHRDARPWLRYCLFAHFRQASTHLRRTEDFKALWVKCAAAAERARLPERVAGALVEAALGMRLRNTSYRTIAETTAAETIAELTASRDLRALVDRGFLAPVGEKRGRYYVGSGELRAMWAEIRGRRGRGPVADPFQTPSPDAQVPLPLGSSRPS